MLIDIYDDFSEEEIAKQTASIRNAWNCGKEAKEVAEKVETLLEIKMSEMQYYCWPQVFETPKPFGDAPKKETMFTIECFVHPQTFQCCLVLEGRVQYKGIFEQFMEYDLIEMIEIKNLVFPEAQSEAYNKAFEMFGGGDINLKVRENGNPIDGFVFRATKRG